MSYYLNINSPEVVETSDDIREESIKMFENLKWTNEEIALDMNRLYQKFHPKGPSLSTRRQSRYYFDLEDDLEEIESNILYGPSEFEKHHDSLIARLKTEEECQQYFDTQKPRKFPIIVENSRFDRPDLIHILTSYNKN